MRSRCGWPRRDGVSRGPEWSVVEAAARVRGARDKRSAISDQPGSELRHGRGGVVGEKQLDCGIGCGADVDTVMAG
jgi:hypothetical protein